LEFGTVLLLHYIYVYKLHRLSRIQFLIKSYIAIKDEKNLNFHCISLFLSFVFFF